MLDIVATCYDVCGITYPAELNGNKIPRLEGESFASVFENDHGAERKEPMFWEHQGNRAVRHGKCGCLGYHWQQEHPSPPEISLVQH